MSERAYTHHQVNPGRMLALADSGLSLYICAVSGSVEKVVDEEDTYYLQPTASDCNQLSLRSDFLFNILLLPVRYGREDWDGNGAAALSAASFENAVSFVGGLPASLPNPRVVVDSDGDVCFKWNRSKYDKVEVTISGEGEYYAITVMRGMKRSSLTNSRREITCDIERMLEC